MKITKTTKWSVYDFQAACLNFRIMKFADEPAVNVDSAVTRRPVCKGCTAAAGHVSTTLIGKLCSVHMYIDA